LESVHFYSRNPIFLNLRTPLFFFWIVVFVLWINLIDLLVTPLSYTAGTTTCFNLLFWWTSLFFFPAPPYFVNSPPLCHAFVLDMFYFLRAPPTFDIHAPLYLYLLSLGLFCYYDVVPLMFTSHAPPCVCFELLFVVTCCSQCFTVHTSFTSCTSHIIYALSYFCFPLLSFFIKLFLFYFLIFEIYQKLQK